MFLLLLLAHEGLRYCSDSQEDEFSGKHLIITRYKRDTRSMAEALFELLDCNAKNTGVRWEVCNSLAILSHLVTSSHLLPSYKITKQLSSRF